MKYFNNTSNSERLRSSTLRYILGLAYQINFILLNISLISYFLRDEYELINYSIYNKFDSTILKLILIYLALSYSNLV